jgi:hypothetical protein
MKIPEFLGETGRKWAERVVKSFKFSDHEIEAVWQAAGCLDRITEAQKGIAENGAVVENRHHELKANPSVALERDNKILFCRLCRELNLFEGKAPDTRIPRKE